MSKLGQLGSLRPQAQTDLIGCLKIPPELLFSWEKLHSKATKRWCCFFQISDKPIRQSSNHTLFSAWRSVTLKAFGARAVRYPQQGKIHQVRWFPIWKYLNMQKSTKKTLKIAFKKPFENKTFLKKSMALPGSKDLKPWQTPRPGVAGSTAKNSCVPSFWHPQTSWWSLHSISLDVTRKIHWFLDVNGLSYYRILGCIEQL